MTSLPYLVAGGGIAGLSAALGLAKAGHGVRLFEQAAAFEEVGAGLQMSPNGVRALRELGAWEAVEPSCVIPSEIHVRSGVSGALLQRIRLGKPFEQRFGAPYRVCHRADLLAGLVAAARQAPSIELNTGRRAVSCASGAGKAKLIFADGETEGTAIIAADGIRSTLRQLVCGEVRPTGRGHTIYRALLPLEKVPAEIEADCVTLWLCPGGHVVHYPVSNWRNFNIVAAIDGTLPATDWGQQTGGADLTRAFRSCCEELQALMSSPVSWLCWAATDLPDLPAWSKNNIVLVGDAAHATLPYLAQGAVMAIEDAAVLSRLLKGGLADDGFRRFEALRRPRTARVQAQSRKLGRIYHARGPTALARDAVLRLTGSALADRQTSWLYSWTP